VSHGDVEAKGVLAHGAHLDREHIGLAGVHRSAATTTHNSGKIDRRIRLLPALVQAAGRGLRCPLRSP
jgi:hypothetical protein